MIMAFQPQNSSCFDRCKTMQDDAKQFKHLVEKLPPGFVKRTLKDSLKEETKNVCKLITNKLHKLMPEYSWITCKDYEINLPFDNDDESSISLTCQHWTIKIIFEMYFLNRHNFDCADECNTCDIVKCVKCNGDNDGECEHYEINNNTYPFRIVSNIKILKGSGAYENIYNIRVFHWDNNVKVSCGRDQLSVLKTLEYIDLYHKSKQFIGELICCELPEKGKAIEASRELTINAPINTLLKYLLTLYLHPLKYVNDALYMMLAIHRFAIESPISKLPKDVLKIILNEVKKSHNESIWY